MIDLIGRKVKYDIYDSKKFCNVTKQGTLVCFGVTSVEVYVNTQTPAIVLLPDGSFANINIEKISLVDPLENENE